MDLTLVIKVLGRRISYNVLHNRIFNIWQTTHPIKLMDIENVFFVKFSAKRDYLKVLTEGPWSIFGHYISVEPWSPDFQPSQSVPSRIMAWVRLPFLPAVLYKRSLIEAIGNQIGLVIKIDYQTNNSCRGRFARMAININLKKPLFSKANTNLQESEAVTVSDPPRPENVIPEELYGPWMLVKHRQERKPCQNISPTAAIKEVTISNSKFNPIFEADHDTLSDPTPGNQAAIDVTIRATHQAITSNQNMPSNDSNTVNNSLPKPSASKAKNKGKTQVSLRKPPTFAPPQKPSGHASSSNSAAAITLLSNHRSSSLKPYAPVNPKLPSIHRSSSLPQLPHSSPNILDPSKHVAITLNDSANPPLPLEVTTGSSALRSSNRLNSVEASVDGPQAMVE
ncbi:uncharacterized protein LOC120138683 [Hibiscus syriacus]|uniref:uncharacterized protein LOC120138683 n=1 Tax=Hibiscus syriacus TaxID=106335 RepID=UPI00192319AB|nr:uncharacterized protein LOC120138683 [Hibiscus syriacus]